MLLVRRFYKSWGSPDNWECGRIECHGDAHCDKLTYQKWTVLGPMGLFQKPAKPPGPAAVEARRRASLWACRKKGRKLLKMREPGRNDMLAGNSCVLSSAPEKRCGLSGDSGLRGQVTARVVV
jgi:hypothetical protein